MNLIQVRLLCLGTGLLQNFAEELPDVVMVLAEKDVLPLKVLDLIRDYCYRMWYSCLRIGVTER